MAGSLALVSDSLLSDDKIPSGFGRHLQLCVHPRRRSVSVSIEMDGAKKFTKLKSIENILDRFLQDATYWLCRALY